MEQVERGPLPAHATAEGNRTLPEREIVQAGYLAAVRTAMIAAVFCCVVVVLMAVNTVKSRAYDPLNAPKLLRRQLDLNRDPQNTRLRAEVRRLDREIRTAYFRSRRFAVQGSYLLLGGVVVFLLATEVARALRPSVPLPLSPTVEEVAMAAVQGRRGVATVGVVGAGLLLLLTVLSRNDRAAEYARAAAAGTGQGGQPAVASVEPGRDGRHGNPAPGSSSVGSAGNAVASDRSPAVAAGRVSTQGDTGTGTVLGEPAGAEVRTHGSAEAPATRASTAAGRVEPMPAPLTVLLPAGGEAEWPVFRGGAGFAPGASAPTVWDVKTGRGILWRAVVPLPGRGSPVVWGDQIFLTGADASRRAVYSFSVEKGDLLWQTFLPAPSTPPLKVQAETGYAPATPVTDGRHVCAVFPDGLVVCLSASGRILWTRDLGRPENPFGHAASPVIYADLLIVPLDQGKGEDTAKSRLYALSLTDGRTVWEVARPVPSAWATPLLIRAGDRDLLVLSANPWVIAYDPRTGREQWRARCMAGDVAPSPAVGGGWVFVCNQRAALVAIRPDGTGDVTQTHVGWQFDESLPDIASPVSDGAFVYLALSEGLVICVDARTGKKVWEYETVAPVHASPLILGSTLYVTDTEGTTHLLTTGGAMQLIGKASVGEEVQATPAVARGRLFLRGQKHLFCIGGQ
ncbi:MAG: PQQ-binding-like beta-propeller repeat protein [Chloroherpetonaceae bacterium]|nr:PQQ-binding-like beta-propeller repeat protein [Chthonomonadaceae bacterium]MDW8208551.1 PQQ-binding-like beta-propeller repeat protein [Chloroherpetonaceae bacterium]